MSQHEKILEENLVNSLVDQSAWRSLVLSGTTVKEHEEALLSNLRVQLTRLNADKFISEPLTDAEFNRLRRTLLEGDIFDAALMLTTANGVELSRDDGSRIYLKLISERPENNTYQVVRQLRVPVVSAAYSAGDRSSNIPDVILLINGLPVVQIELKKRGEPLSQAFAQFQRYHREGTYNGILRFVQLCIISNGVNTRYFANSPQQFEKENQFTWQSEKNKIYGDLLEFAHAFLNNAALLDFILDYRLLPKNTRMIMIARAHQYHAVKAASRKALEALGGNGHIWHATGSGKTYTAFLAAREIERTGRFAKVIFLLDRKDLDTQTSENMNEFQPGSVTPTDSTDDLFKKLQDPQCRLVVTTVQKMSNLAKSLMPHHVQLLARLNEQGVMFIVDECHRSHFGDMHKYLLRRLPAARYLGFTGTPIFEQNKPNDGRLTSELFGEVLHSYTMQDSIRDGNTLPLNATYVETAFDEDGQPVSTLKDDKYAPARINVISLDILKNYDRRFLSTSFNALLTTDAIAGLRLYYMRLQELNAQRPVDKQLRIAAIFSTQDNQENLSAEEQSDTEFLAQVIRDYNDIFGTHFNLSTKDEYIRDVQARLKNGTVDLCLVVDMLLTGFDSKFISQVFFDRDMVYHSLFQASSRPNRKALDKYEAHLRFYRPGAKENLDNALLLFSNTEDISSVVITYEQRHSEFLSACKELQAFVSTPADVDDMGEADKTKFVKTFAKLHKAYKIVNRYVEFDNDRPSAPINAQEIADYRSKYHDIRSDVESGKYDEDSPLRKVTFVTLEVANDIINVDYLERLLNNYENLDERDQKRVAQGVTELRYGGSGNDSQAAEVMESYLAYANSKPRPNPFLNYDQYRTKTYENLSAELAHDLGWEHEQLENYFNDYLLSGSENESYARAHIQAPSLLTRVKKLKSLSAGIKRMRVLLGR